MTMTTTLNEVLGADEPLKLPSEKELKAIARENAKERDDKDARAFAWSMFEHQARTIWHSDQSADDRARQIANLFERSLNSCDELIAVQDDMRKTNAPAYGFATESRSGATKPSTGAKPTTTAGLVEFLREDRVADPEASKVLAESLRRLPEVTKRTSQQRRQEVNPFREPMDSKSLAAALRR